MVKKVTLKLNSFPETQLSTTFDEQISNQSMLQYRYHGQEKEISPGF